MGFSINMMLYSALNEGMFMCLPTLNYDCNGNSASYERPCRQPFDAVICCERVNGPVGRRNTISPHGTECPHFSSIYYSLDMKYLSNLFT